MTRIVGGGARGSVLRVPQGARPTSERVREALFGRLEHRGWIRGSRVMDLYAGSGALGLEAASRGAVRVDLVERSARARGALRSNVRSARAEGVAHVWIAPVAQLLGGRRGPTPRGDVDLVLVDPPYDLAEPELAAALAMLEAWLAPDCLVCVERSKRSPEPGWPPFLAPRDRRRYGETDVWFARRASPAA